MRSYHKKSETVYQGRKIMLAKKLINQKKYKEFTLKKIGLLPNLEKDLASCETKKASSPGHMGRIFSSEPF
jgi:hypothetical protein